MNSQKISSWIVQSLFITFILQYFIKLSYIVGSYHMFFSGSNIILPVTAVYSSLPCLGLIFFFRCFNALFNPFLFITHYLPGIGAALSMRFNHWFISVLIPACCMFLFIMHPIAGQVWIYSLYWLIPMIIFVVEQLNGSRNRFLQALRSTFIAHAIGSVIWAYLKPMTIAQWQLLIPLVMVERLVFAGSITICCIAIDWIKSRGNIKLWITNARVVES